MSSSLENAVGNGNPFNTHDMRYEDARREREAKLEIERLLRIAKNKKLSKRRRRTAYNEALELCKSFHGTGFDSCDDSAKDCLSCDTDPGNSSVSSVSAAVSSDSEGTKKDLRERFVLKTDDDWRHYETFLEERKSEKRIVKKNQKKAAKRASQLKAAGAEAAAAKAIVEQRRQAEEQKSRILDIMLQNPVANFPFLLALVGFLWNTEGSNYSKSRSTHRLFKGDRYPSQEKIVEEIGPLAWQSIHQKLFSAAYYELEFFRNQKEAEDRSSRFIGSLFDFNSDADDEGDN
jgi:hypothetical protein